jgi:hypothetical protein
MPAAVIRMPCSSNDDEALEMAQRRKLDFPISSTSLAARRCGYADINVLPHFRNVRMTNLYRLPRPRL